MTAIKKYTDTPMVSVWMITYNHEPYIAQAIEGVLMQKTNFQFELIIGEDCSTDNTAAIIKEYEANYPKIIKARYNNSNMGMITNMVKTLEECNGKYIAMCEGDDYWTDPLKLQKQVDFLESNSDCSICFHNALIVADGKFIRQTNLKQKTLSNQAELALGNFIATTTVLFVNRIKSYPEWLIQLPAGDYPLHLLNANHGQIGFINECMACYRVHINGVWSNKNKHDEIINTVECLLFELVGKINQKVDQSLLVQIINKLEQLNNMEQSFEIIDRITVTLENGHMINLLMKHLLKTQTLNSKILNSKNFKFGNFINRLRNQIMKTVKLSKITL